MRAPEIVLAFAVGLEASAGAAAVIVPTPGRGRPAEEAGPAQAPPPSTVIKRREVIVPRPAAEPAGVVDDARRPPVPRQDASGAPITADPVQSPPPHAPIVRDPRLTEDILERQRAERQAGVYYWHTFGGIPYAHYYDPLGTHWYGFHAGPSFYWTRFHGGRWWWHDPRFQRWVYWHDDHWWWPSPYGTQYVYVDNNYYPYREGTGVVTKEPQVSAPPAGRPGSWQEGSVYLSPDGRRLVQVAGARREAFLYERPEAGEPVFRKYLADGVRDVRFIGGEEAPRRIRLSFTDKRFALYDYDGDPRDDGAD